MTLLFPRIGCLDLDTFFVSVERILDPSLEGKPVIVGGRPGSRGVVTACSYEVRKFGVRSGMSLTKAAELAPDAIYLPTSGGIYSEYSKQVREIAARFVPEIQIASIDEMFFDLSGCEAMYRKPQDADDDATIERVVRELTATIQTELKLPASVGIATSRSLSKIASGVAKPRGVLLVPSGTEKAFLAPLPVRKLPGIGPVAEAKLNGLGIQTLGEIANTPLPLLQQVFGAWATRVHASAQGQGSSDLSRDRPAFREHDPSGETQSTISNERTFREDVTDPRTIEAQLCHLCDRVSWRARKRGVKARTVSLKLRYADFETLTRSRTIQPTCSELEIYPVIKELFDKARTRRTRIRLLGVSLMNLGLYDDQLELFAPNNQLHTSVDKIREKYGFDAVRRAGGQSKKHLAVREDSKRDAGTQENTKRNDTKRNDSRPKKRAD